MIALVVSVRIKPEERERFLKGIEVDANGSRNDERGCFRFDVLQDQNDPNHYFFYEIYRDEAALEAHRQAPHYSAWGSIAHTVVSEPTQVTRCTTVFPTDAELEQGKKR